MSRACVCTLVAGLVFAVSAPPLAGATARPRLLVVGVYHMDNPGRDAVNLQADDVLAPRRQREIERVAAALAVFRPTVVAVEWPAAEQARLDARFADVALGRAAMSRNEIEQLGFRVARRAGLARIAAIDWNEMPATDIARFDYEAFAATHGQQARLDAIRAGTRRRVAAVDAVQKTGSVGDVLRAINDPRALDESRRAYFEYALLGEGPEYPGAEWVQFWYGRNLKIFANLCRLAPGPNDRVLVLIGAGHAPLLREFAAQSGRFTVEEPLGYVRE